MYGGKASVGSPVSVACISDDPLTSPPGHEIDTLKVVLAKKVGAVLPCIVMGESKVSAEATDV